MALEATMICVDNSEWMRNEDYPPSRFEAQRHAFAILCGAKTQAKESTVGLLAMAAGKGVSVLVTLTNDFSKVLLGMNGLQIGGEANLTAAIQVAQLVLKNRKNKQLQQRIIVFVGSPVKDKKNLLEVLGKKLKKNNVALDVVDFGESDDEKPEKLEALVAAVNSGGNSHIIHIPAGDVLSDVIISSPILSEDRGGDSAAAAASGASGFEFGVDPSVDRELALLQISMEERARQEAVAKIAREESYKTESEGQSSTSNGDIAMADTEPEPNSYTEDERLLHMDEDELMRQAQELSTEYFRCAELLEGVTYEEAMSALRSTFREGETGTLSDASKVFGDQPFAQSLHDVEFLSDLSYKDQLERKEQLIGPSEDGDELYFRCAELLDSVTDDEAMSALQSAFQEEETGTQSDASKVFGDQPFAQSLPDVEFLSGLSYKDQMERKEQLIGPSEDEDELLRQAQGLSTEYFRFAELLEGVTNEETMSALQSAFQEEETGTQSDTSKVFGDQPYAKSLPDVEFLNDLSYKDQLERKEQLIGPSEVQPKRQHKKYKKHKKKKPEKKHEKKEDEPEGDKSQ